jgi:hypothetical protein
VFVLDNLSIVNKVPDLHWANLIGKMTGDFFGHNTRGPAGYQKAFCGSRRDCAIGIVV